MSPHIFNPFIKHLYATLQQKPLTPPPSTRTSNIGKLIDEALQEQYKIGWMQALQGRISGKWREAEAATKGYSPDQDSTGIFPAFIRMLWKTSKAIWLARNELQHGATPEARLKKKQLQLKEAITLLYSQQSTVSFINKTRLFKMNLTTRLQLHPDKNRRWIAIIHSAQQLKHRQEEYLLARTPKLTTYEGYTREEAPPQEISHTDSEEEDSATSTTYTQQSLHAYITIHQVHRNTVPARHKTKQKKYKRTTLHTHGFGFQATPSSPLQPIHRAIRTLPNTTAIPVPIVIKSPLESERAQVLLNNMLIPSLRPLTPSQERPPNFPHPEDQTENVRKISRKTDKGCANVPPPVEVNRIPSACSQKSPSSQPPTPSTCASNLHREERANISDPSLHTPNILEKIKMA